MVLNFRVIVILEQLKDFTRHGKKLFEGFGILICLPISLLLEKRCIKFIWNLCNSPYTVHKSVHFTTKVQLYLRIFVILSINMISICMTGGNLLISL